MAKYSGILVLGTLLMLLSLSAYAQLDVREVTIKIPTYVSGPENLNPPLFDDKVYPYPMQTDLTEAKELIEYKAIELENRYIKVVIVPELGGKILAAFDKTNDNFDFIYNNQVVKPGLVALRGAWISGGIEWNFPTWGHSVNTFAPVNYRIVYNDNNSISVVVGTEEWVRRMKWSVAITLYENRSYIETGIRLANTTLTHNNAYYWSNAATHAWDDTRAIFPPSDYTFLGKRANPRSWPIYNGKDVSWYKNTVESSDFFCATPGNYNGSYNYEKDNGTVHYAIWHDSPGKKFWTWGYSPRGKMWENLLTDEDGQYIEIQAGRLISQIDTWVFEPQMVEEWKEVWYPVKNMKGYQKADDNFALNMERTPEGLLVTANATREFYDLEFILEADGNKLFTWKDNIDPRKGFRKDVISNSKSDSYRFIINDREGNELISYSTRKPNIPEPELQPDMNLVETKTAETEFLKGYYAVKGWDNAGALAHFESSLAMDPGFTLALRWQGIIKYKMGLYKEAEEAFSKALLRNEDDYASRYYRGLIRLAQGLGGQAEYDLYLAGRRAEFSHVAHYVLAGVEIGKGNYNKALELLKTSIKHNDNNAEAHSMLAAVYRHLNKRGDSVRHTRKAIRTDPLCSQAILENVLLDERNDLEHLRDNPEIYIETALKYAQMNLKDDALEILKIYKRRDNVAQHPMLYYFQAWLSSDNPQEVENYLANAIEVNPDYIFPFRLEFEPVLKYAIEKNSSDWKAQYYLGNLLTAKGRWKEGLNHYLLASDQNPEYSVLFSNMAVIYKDKLLDFAAAEKFFARAIACRPDDHTLYPLLDDMLKVNGNSQGRDTLHANVPQIVQERQSYKLCKAKYLYDSGFYQQTLQLLASNSFKPWEANANEPHLIYQLANLKNALHLAGEGKASSAVEHVEAMKAFPTNLGTEKPNNPLQLMESYFKALIMNEVGMQAGSAAELKRIKDLKDVINPEALLYKGLVHAFLDEREESKDIAYLILNSLNATPSEKVRNRPHRLYMLSLANYLTGEVEESRNFLAKLKKDYPLYRKADILEIVIKSK